MQPRKESERHAQPCQDKDMMDDDETEAVLNSVSWPILLAIIPALGAFVAGSAEIWGDFMVVLLMLYYVYKWITVPWSYYEEARSRRLLHQHVIPVDGNNAPLVQALYHHELAILLWVLASPLIAGYTLQYSRYFLSNHDRYLSAFNRTVFVLAASLKPLAHVISLLYERTLYLQRTMGISETPTENLQRKLDWLQEEILGLSEDLATKKEISQMGDDLSPTMERLTRSIKRCERKENDFQREAEEHFALVDQKMRDFDHFMCCFQMDHDAPPCTSLHGTVLTLVFLPLHVAFWTARRMTQLLPITRILLGQSNRSSSLGCKPLPTQGATAILTSARALVDVEEDIY